MGQERWAEGGKEIRPAIQRHGPNYWAELLDDGRMSSDLRGGRTVSLTRWSNKARSFCRHLARVNASEPHTRSMMYPIPGSARSTTEVFDVCFQNMNTSLVVQNMFVIRSLLSVRLSALGPFRWLAALRSLVQQKL